VRENVKQSLIAEQKELCAYTGLRIEMFTSHVEHLIPQEHCTNGLDITYHNMVACYPGPGASAPFGAVKKRNWPSPGEQHLFVSPCSSGCETRFSFSLSGTIRSASANDNAAMETIRRLSLDHKALDRYRKEAIDATLERRGHGPASLDIKSARKRLAQLIQSETTFGSLQPFIFVLKQALQRHIRRIEAIIANRKGQQ
jgi:uncharacterized protein (TIGR02646 family)